MISESESRSVVSSSVWPHGLQSPWNSPCQNTGVGSLSLLQGIFPTQRLNPDLPHCGQILYQLSHKGSPRILKWVAYPSSGSSWPRNQTRVSCIAGRFFTSWATGEAQVFLASYLFSHLSAPSTLRLTFGRISQASIFIDSISSFQSTIYFLSAIPGSTIKVFISLQNSWSHLVFIIIINHHKGNFCL